MNIKDIIEKSANRINELLKLCFNESNDLAVAMKYSLLTPGKRFRPFLVFECNDMIHGNQLYAEKIALAIELIHTYTLIHDDLPCMDNDDYRRGLKSCHKQFSEGIALLAGNALLVKAFEILTQIENSFTLELINAFCKKTYDTLLGQSLDIKNYNSDRTMILKTSSLFILACTSPLIINNQLKNLNIMTDYATELGRLFQIVDDINDGKRKKNETELGQILEKIKYYSKMMNNPKLFDLTYVFYER